MITAEADIIAAREHGCGSCRSWCGLRADPPYRLGLTQGWCMEQSQGINVQPSQISEHRGIALLNSIEDRIRKAARKSKQGVVIEAEVLQGQDSVSEGVGSFVVSEEEIVAPPLPEKSKRLSQHHE